MLDKIKQAIRERDELRDRIADLRWRERVITQAINNAIRLKPDMYISKIKVLARERDLVVHEREQLQQQLKEKGGWWKTLMEKNSDSN